jgi:hypothetical protein
LWLQTIAAGLSLSLQIIAADYHCRLSLQTLVPTTILRGKLGLQANRTLAIGLAGLLREGQIHGARTLKRSMSQIKQIAGTLPTPATPNIVPGCAKAGAPQSQPSSLEG